MLSGPSNRNRYGPQQAMPLPVLSGSGMCAAFLRSNRAMTRSPRKFFLSTMTVPFELPFDVLTAALLSSLKLSPLNRSPFLPS